MSVSQNLLAFFSGAPLKASAASAPVTPGDSEQAQALASFAEILMDQQPEDVEALMQLLGDADGDPAQELLELADLAADGKNLPAGMQDWLAHLDELRSETQEHAALVQGGEVSPEQQQELGALVEDWSQWLDQARQFMATTEGAASASDPAVDVEAAEALAMVAGLAGRDLAARAVQGAGAAVVTSSATIPAAQPQSSALVAEKAGEAEEALLASIKEFKRDTEAPGSQAAREQANRGERDARQEPAGNTTGPRGNAERTGQADGQQPVQRNLDMTPAAVEGRAAFAGKLAETLEALVGRTGGRESDTGEPVLRPGTQAQAAAQGALAARPVLAANQALNVPFGHAGWGDAVMDKMMWMSSQNLRSVEIRLDPADLGPLEIHIQTRGQEHQVQFVTQNPSVREALEAQMFRLREAFSQQGMDLVDVSVGDSAVDQQAHHRDGDSGDGRARSATAGRSLETDEAGMMLASAAAATQAESSRLVDYYA